MTRFSALLLGRGFGTCVDGCQDCKSRCSSPSRQCSWATLNISRTSLGPSPRYLHNVTKDKLCTAKTLEEVIWSCDPKCLLQRLETSKLPKVLRRGRTSCFGICGPKACCTGAKEGCAGAEQGCTHAGLRTSRIYKI